MDIDAMDFPHNNLGALGIDNDALDINDFMNDENILQGKENPFNNVAKPS